MSYPKPSVTVDLVIFTVTDTDLKLLLIKRTPESEAYPDCWALPGGFVNEQEDLAVAARRELNEETALRQSFLEQLYTFGTPLRDPRGWVITVGYYALIPAVRMTEVRAGDDAVDARWVSVTELDDYDVAFDHEIIIGTAVERIQGKIDYAPIARGLVPETFTVSELREVYAAVKGKTYSVSTFRRRFKRMQTDGVIERAPGKRETGGKPAAVYRFAT